jgi:ubiquinone/menaquinone biosynthesis C-methylase UbiE
MRRGARAGGAQQAADRQPPTGGRAAGEHAGTELTAGEHAPGEHAGAELAPGEHAPGEHAGTELAPGEHAPGEHAGTELAPGEHAPGEHAGTELAPGEHPPGEHTAGERVRQRDTRWEEAYPRDGLFSVIHQDRQARALHWIDGLGLSPGSRVLEVGPGAGLLTVALARREFIVHAADTTPRQLDIARSRAAAAGVAPRVRLMLADARRLPFADREFSLVVALSVVPWLRSVPLAVTEMARVLRPGGYLIVNADNSGRLALLLDPRHNPALTPARLAARSLLHSADTPRPAARARATARRAEFDAILRRAGLELISRSTFGFGPFTMFGLPVASGRAGTRLSTRLQRLADQGLPGLRSAGAQYLVLARAPVGADTQPAGDPLS